LAQAFFDVGVEAMALALRRVSVGRGYDLREHALVPFGAAAGQYACAVARAVGIRHLVHHPLAGIFSAYGISRAAHRWHGEAALGAIDATLTEAVRAALNSALSRLSAEGAQVLGAADDDPGESASPSVRVTLGLGYAGSDTTLELATEPLESAASRFHMEHHARFGYAAQERRVEARVLYVEVSLPQQLPTLQHEYVASPEAQANICFGGEWFSVPLLHGESIREGSRLSGPALIVEATSTFVLEPDFEAEKRPGGALWVEHTAAARRVAGAVRASDDPAALEVFEQRFRAIAEEMGAVFRRTAASTNIRERLDFSCAVFDAEGALVANAPHIPVHLGSMGATVRALYGRHADWRPGDVYLSNSPALGGTHLPDVTVVSAVFCGEATPQFFLASRGHHEDVGGATPGSMPVDSRRLADEGIVLEDVHLVRDGLLAREEMLRLLRSGAYPARRPEQNLADLEAAVAANGHGAGLLEVLVEAEGLARVRRMMAKALDHGEAAVRRALDALPRGERSFEDFLDSGERISVRLTLGEGALDVDFSGTSPETSSNLNAPASITRAATLYVLRLLVDEELPLNDGCLRPVVVHIPPGSLLSPSAGCAVAAGNVETSQRVVDVLLGALGVVAASQGTMNNLSFGDASFGYYETLGGGAGAGPEFHGASGVHTHMTNSRITDPEVLEARFPVRVRRFAIRQGSGGAGRHHGGEGLLREFEFLSPQQVSLISERRTTRPYGVNGGEAGSPGRNRLNGRDVGGRVELTVQPGDVLTVETPGGGGYGAPA